VTTPDTLPDDVAALRALVLMAWAERDAERAENGRLIEERDQLAGQNDRLRHLLRQLQRMQFGRRSEKLDPDQFNLALEDLEQAVAASEAEQEKADPALRQVRSEKRRAGRGALPEHLPRVEIVVDPEDTACPCCGGAMHVIGEDCSQRLDVIPAQYRVIVTRRPKYACRTCQEGVVQAPAPARLIEGGLPTERLVAHVVVAKYADHCPLYRQAQILARQGITIDRATLAFWVGYAAAEITPVWRLLRHELLSSTKLFVDETTAPVLDPGRGRTKKGYFWVLARDDRPWRGGAPPAVVYTYAPGRSGNHAETLLRGYTGVLQTDGYAAYRSLADPKRAGGPVTLAFCRVGGGVAIPAPHRPGRADFPHPVLRAQASLTGRRIGGRSRLAAVGIDRAWPGSVSTADGCGVRVERAISSRSAGAGGDTSEPAGRFP
jgi:transposase